MNWTLLKCGIKIYSKWYRPVILKLSSFLRNLRSKLNEYKSFFFQETKPNDDKILTWHVCCPPVFLRSILHSHFLEHDKCPDTRGRKRKKGERETLATKNSGFLWLIDTGCKPSQGAYRSWTLSKPVPLPLTRRTKLSPIVPKDRDKLALQRRDYFRKERRIDHVADDIWWCSVSRN